MRTGSTDDSFRFINRAVPLKKSKILIGAYIGTLVPAFFIVAFTGGTVLVHILACTVLRCPPGGAWELLQSHGRDHYDRILAGPQGHIVNIQEKAGSQKESQKKSVVG